MVREQLLMVVKVFQKSQSLLDFRNEFHVEQLASEKTNKVQVSIGSVNNKVICFNNNINNDQSNEQLLNSKNPQHIVEVSALLFF